MVCTETVIVCNTLGSGEFVMWNLKPFFKCFFIKVKKCILFSPNIEGHGVQLCKFNITLCFFHITLEKIKVLYCRLSFSENLDDPILFCFLQLFTSWL